MAPADPDPGPGVGLRPLTVAFEGPSRAGKSTTIEAIRRDPRTFTLEVVPEFSDFVGGGSLLPPLIPATADERLDAVRELAAIDERRCAPALNSRADVVVLDRSLHSVLAISYGLERVLELPVFDGTRALLQQTASLWPDLIFFLVAPSALRVARSRDRSEDNPHVTGPLQEHVQQYFEVAARTVPIDFLRADVPLEDVAARARAVIERQLRLHGRGRRARRSPAGGRTDDRIAVR